MNESQHEEQAETGTEIIYSWRVFPAKANPKKTVFVSMAIILLSLASGWYAGVPLGVLAVLLLSGSLWPFFMITTYRFTSEGIEQKRWPTTQKKSWDYFRRYEVDPRGILLSPFKTPSRLDPFRGMYLLTTNDREQLLSIIESKVGVKREAE